VAQITAAGMTPVDFLISVMRDDTRPIELLIDAAGRAAPVHALLAAVDVAASRWRAAHRRDREVRL
jgi:hypothetical protein